MLDLFQGFLGGREVNLTTISDASFSPLEEVKSVKTHLIKPAWILEQFMMHVGVVRNVVTSVWEAEIKATSDAYDTMTYL